LGDGYRIAASDWLGKLSEDLPDETVFTNVRRVDGIDRVLPLSFEDWPAAVLFELGCHHEHHFMSLDVVRVDCGAARQMAQRVERRIEPRPR
jgi:hypothetical protein